MSWIGCAPRSGPSRPISVAALVRSAFYGQSATEIAEAEDIPLGTAKSRIRLGLSKVRAILDGEEG